MASCCWFDFFVGWRMAWFSLLSASQPAFGFFFSLSVSFSFSDTTPTARQRRGSLARSLALNNNRAAPFPHTPLQETPVLVRRHYQQPSLPWPSMALAQHKTASGSPCSAHPRRPRATPKENETTTNIRDRSRRRQESRVDGPPFGCAPGGGWAGRETKTLITAPPHLCRRWDGPSRAHTYLTGSAASVYRRLATAWQGACSGGNGVGKARRGKRKGCGLPGVRVGAGMMDDQVAMDAAHKIPFFPFLALPFLFAFFRKRRCLEA
ncbi:uncharacterized protein BKA78DRAFT_363634 [Phyllosticta capitalensis]|uniref:uncharacterized protein n=1 Tax=Phyllosticta capitalensis TaxID=121624 RepID=UPI00312FEB04